MLHRMAHFMGSNAHSGHTVSVVHSARQAHCLGTGVIVIRQFTIYPLYTHIVQPVGIKDLPGHFGPVSPAYDLSCK